MQSKSIFRRIILSLLGLITSMSLAMGQMGNMGGMPSMDDIQAMEAEIDKFVRSLPPEQQKQFYKDVEELTGIMEKMTPDELNDFVGNVFTEAGLVEPPAPAKPAQKPEPKAEKETKPAVVVTTAPSGPTEKAVNMIKAIIKRTEEFMRKAQVIPELQAKMNKWVVQKKLLDVAANLDWQAVEIQIDELNVLLYSLIEPDHVTKQYKHIGNLIKDEALYNNLATLQVTLESYVPTIEIPPFGLENVSKESRAAIREVLSQYLEAFYLLNVPTAIKKVKTLYEPRAKELKEEEKQRTEQAYKEAQKTRTPAPALKSPGTKAPYTPAPYTPPSRPEPTPTPYYPAGYTYESRSSSYDNKPSTGGGSTAGGKTSSGSKAPKEGERGKEGKEDRGREETFGEETSAPPSGGKSPTTKTPGKDDKGQGLGRRAGMILYRLDDGMQKLKAFEKEFKDISSVFTSPNDFTENDPKLKDRVTAMESANTSLKGAISDIKKIKDDIKALSPESQAQYKTLIPVELSAEIKFYEAVNKSINDAANVKAHKDHYQIKRRNKYYIFFGDGNPEDAVRKAVPTVPVNIELLGKTIGEFLKEAK